MKSLLSSLAGLLLFAALPQAQITKAPASPRARLTQQVGLTEISLDYGRPGVKGRQIFGGLEPYGRVWRTGANASTKIRFEDPVQFAGRDVPAGTYGLYTIPQAKTWTVILSRDADLWGAGGYDPVNDQLRVEVPVQALPAVQESLKLDFDGFHANGADLVIAWEKVQVRVPVFVDTDARVYAEIDEKIRESGGQVSAQTYFDAGMFYYEKNTDLPQAAAWMEQAIELSPQAFWMVYMRAELAHAMGDTEAARTGAQRAHEMAKASERGDFGYIARSKLLLDKLADEAKGEQQS